MTKHVERHDRKQTALDIWTVFASPEDFPNTFIARRFETTAKGPRPTNDIIVNADIDALRNEFEEAGLVCVTRSPEDDPVIVESWL